MKLHKLLTIGGNTMIIAADNINLDLWAPGRAMFTVSQEKEPTGLVEYSIGYKDHLVPYFVGVIESATQTAGAWHLTCRELLGTFASISKPMALRHPTALDVLNELGPLSLTFLPAEAPYMEKKIPFFYHQGDALSALRQIGKAFDIPNFIVQQRADSRIYVGAWEHSGWQDKPIKVPDHVFKSQNAASATVLALPQLRPGILLNNKYVSQVTFSGLEQKIVWSHLLYAV